MTKARLDEWGRERAELAARHRAELDESSERGYQLGKELGALEAAPPFEEEE
jgi:hypothetical protein